MGRVDLGMFSTILDILVPRPAASKIAFKIYHSNF